jgi:hypothetical protein
VSDEVLLQSIHCILEYLILKSFNHINDSEECHKNSEFHINAKPIDTCAARHIIWYWVKMCRRPETNEEVMIRVRDIFSNRNPSSSKREISFQTGNAAFNSHERTIFDPPSSFHRFMPNSTKKKQQKDENFVLTKYDKTMLTRHWH